jgi:MFS transporter, ACS family, D-galactonate transporter
LGVGEAPTFSANAKAIGHWFPAKERGFATAIFDAAAKFSSAIGVPLIGILLLQMSWRWSFAFTGFISLGYFFLFWKIYRDPKDDPELTNRELEYIAKDVPTGASVDLQQTRASLGYLIRQRKVIGLAIGFGSYNYVFYLLLTWLPSYLSSFCTAHRPIALISLYRCSVALRDSDGLCWWRADGWAHSGGVEREPCA